MLSMNDAQGVASEKSETARQSGAEAEKVFFYLPALSGGGAELVFVRISNALVARGVPVQMILNVRQGPFLEMLDPRVEVVALGHPVSVRAMPALMRHLRGERPRCLVSAMTTLNLVAILAAKLSFSGTRVVACERNTFSEVTRTTGALRRTVLTLLVRVIYPFADTVIGNTDGVAADITRVAQLRKGAEVIHNPAPAQEDGARARAAPTPHPWLGDGKGPVAVAMGRLKRQKDYETMIRALGLVRCDLRLIILGEGPEKAALEDLARDVGVSDRVAFEGFRMNRFDYLARADLFLISSLVEGFPNALIEAVSFGVPCVATDFKGGGAQEILGRDCPSSIVPVGDAAAFARCIDETLMAPPDATSLARIVARYDIETITSAFLDKVQACR